MRYSRRAINVVFLLVSCALTSCGFKFNAGAVGPSGNPVSPTSSEQTVTGEENGQGSGKGEVPSPELSLSMSPSSATLRAGVCSAEFTLSLVSSGVEASSSTSVILTDDGHWTYFSDSQCTVPLSPSMAFQRNVKFFAKRDVLGSTQLLARSVALGISSQSDISMLPGPASIIVLNGSSSLIAGSSSQYQVAFRDQFGNSTAEVSPATFNFSGAGEFLDSSCQNPMSSFFSPGFTSFTFCYRNFSPLTTASLQVSSVGMTSGTLLVNVLPFPAPTVSGVSPLAGLTSGGTSLTVSGSGFRAGAAVLVGSAACETTSFSAASIVCTTTAHSAGPVDVVVTNTDLQSGTRSEAFTYVNPAPSVSGVSPTSGLASGGTTLTVSGSGFLSNATVLVGNAACAITSLSANTIVCTTSARMAGLVSVSVANVDSQSASLANAFTYENLSPTISEVQPTAGSTTGGTFLTITGSGFLAGATVMVGGAACNVESLTASQIVCETTARSAGLVSMTVTNPDLKSGSRDNAYTYMNPAPVVSSVSPTSGPSQGGTLITIGGTGFQAGPSVQVGSSDCVVQDVTSTSILCRTTSGAAGLVGVTVTNADLQSGSRLNLFTYVAPPAIGKVTPSTGSTAGGTDVVISGTGFLPGATVQFGGLAGTSVVVSGGTSISCKSPAHVAGPVWVRVINPDLQSDTEPSAFNYVNSAPGITSASPSTGPIAGGTALTINGTGFLSNAVVLVGDTECTVSTLTSSSITCTTGAHAAGLVGIQVTNADGQFATKPDLFTYAGSHWSSTSITGDVAPARIYHTTVWTGSKMIVWGGDGPGAGNDYYDSGAMYDPVTDSWAPMSTGPAARRGHTAVWTGSEMIVWGGVSQFNQRLNTGGKYDPGTDTWEPTKNSGAGVPTERLNHIAVWAGDRMIIWGGDSTQDSTNTGAYYFPGSDSWSVMPVHPSTPSARQIPSVVWTGSEMIIWGGYYHGALDGGARFTPSTGTWVTLPTANSPAKRYYHSAVWTGGQMVVWGGFDSTALASGATYNRAIDSWTQIANAPIAKYGHSAVWTGSLMLIWGRNGAGMIWNGNPVGWSTMPTEATEPDAARSHSVVWTGTQMVVWGGQTGTGIVQTGGRYTP